MKPRKKILLVDPNETRRNVLQYVIEIRGFRAICVESGGDAIERLRAGGIDLVLAELIMPKMDGNEMALRMKDFAAEIPVVLHSATVRSFDRARFADAFLPKGACTPAEIFERVRVLIFRKRGPRKAKSVPCETQVSLSCHATMGPEFLDPELRNRKVEVPA